MKKTHFIAVSLMLLSLGAAPQAEPLAFPPPAQKVGGPEGMREPLRLEENSEEFKTAHAFLEHARRLERQGESERARRIYLAIMQKFPKMAAPHHRLALLALREDDHATAEKQLEQAMALDPSNPNIHSDRGYLLYLQGRFADAEKMLRSAESIAPTDARIQNNLGLVLGRLGRMDECLAAFRKGGTEAEALANLAFVHALRGELVLAETHYKQALTKEPKLESAAQALGELAERRLDNSDLTPDKSDTTTETEPADGPALQRSMPVTQATTPPDVNPVPDAMPVPDANPSPEIKSVAESRPVPDARLKLETKMAEAKKPTPEATPSIETETADANEPVHDTKPNLENKTADVKQPMNVAKPKLETKTPNEKELIPVAKPTVETKTADAKEPMPVAKPSVETTTAEAKEPMPAAEPSVENKTAEAKDAMPDAMPSAETKSAAVPNPAPTEKPVHEKKTAARSEPMPEAAKPAVTSKPAPKTAQANAADPKSPTTRIPATDPAASKSTQYDSVTERESSRTSVKTVMHGNTKIITFERRTEERAEPVPPAELSETSDHASSGGQAELSALSHQLASDPVRLTEQEETDMPRVVDQWDDGLVEDAPPLIQAFIDGLKDANASVRRYSAMTLACYGPRAGAAVPALTVALEDQEENVQAAAAIALAEVGSAAEVAVPILMRKLRQDNPKVVSVAAWSLEKIGNSVPKRGIEVQSRYREATGMLQTTSQEGKRLATWLNRPEPEQPGSDRSADDAWFSLAYVTQFTRDYSFFFWALLLLQLLILVAIMLGRRRSSVLVPATGSGPASPTADYRNVVLIQQTPATPLDSKVLKPAEVPDMVITERLPQRIKKDK